MTKSLTKFVGLAHWGCRRPSARRPAEYTLEARSAHVPHEALHAC
jgi:hypothetical protein